MKNIKYKIFRSFQIEVAPGAYGVFTFMGSFMFFISENWLITLMSWLWVGLMCYLDKPFLFILLQQPRKFKLFISLVFISLSSPTIIVYTFNSAISEFFSFLLIPVGGLLVAFLVYFLYSQDILINNGWVKKE